MGQVLERAEGWDLLIQLVYLLLVVAQPWGGKTPVTCQNALHAFFCVNNPINGQFHSTQRSLKGLFSAAAPGNTLMAQKSVLNLAN